MSNRNTYPAAWLVGVALAVLLPSLAIGITTYVVSLQEQSIRNPYLVGTFGAATGAPEYDTRYIRKFGETARDSLTDGQDVWNCPTLAVAVPENYVYASSAFTAYISSDDANDAAAAIVVEGLDENWERQRVVATLGAAAATSGTAIAEIGSGVTWLRIFRAFPSGSAPLEGNIYIGNDNTDAGTDGIPDDLTELQACILIGDNQTQMTHYTTAEGEETYIRSICVYGEDASSGTPGSASVGPYLRSFGQTFRVQAIYALHSDGTNAICRDLPYPVYLPPKTDLVGRIVEDNGLDRVSATYDIVSFNTVVVGTGD